MVHSRTGIVYKQPAGIHRDFPGGIKLHKRTIHGPGCRTFEVHTLAVISASMAGALEFVFSRFPFRSASQVRAAGENDEKAVGLADNPHAVGHQEALIDAQSEVRRKSDIKNSIWLI